jgi:phosphoribosyl 1,2-cyclic phosphodiesterase
MHVTAHCIASGSSGNAVLIQAGAQYLLIDAGVGPRILAAALQRRGVALGNLCAILLTHEHDDHLKGAPSLSKRLNAPVVANRATLDAACQRVELTNVYELPSGAEDKFGPFKTRSFRVSHDAAEPVGYVVEVAGTRISYATDIGCTSLQLKQAMSGAQLCILESNHDLEWLRRGPYPPHMKVRVASDHGHLSNRDAVGVIAERLEEDGPATFWLAHLSAVNNSPTFARRYADTEIKTRTKVAHKLEIALRDRPSVSWQRGAIATQLSLF